MQQTQWDKLTDKERYEYLARHKPVVQNQTGLRADSKVGDNDDDMITVHRIKRGGVVTTDDFEDPSKVILQDKDVMREWHKRAYQV